MAASCSRIAIVLFTTALAVAGAAATGTQAQPPGKTHARLLSVDVSRAIGDLKPLRGVNGPPDIRSIDPQALGHWQRGPDVSAGYRAARVTLIRTHDSYGAASLDKASGELPPLHGPGGPPGTASAMMDLNVLFPDEGADPQDPASYHWGQTDRLVSSIRALGADVLFRLGREGMTTAPPPADLARYAEIIRHVVLHYDRGWANGFQDAVRYWEVWNEPDLGQIWWRGTPEQYYALYAAAARAVKAADPDALVGGPTIAVVNQPGPYREGFLDFVKAQALPLDFFSWHWYSTDADDPYDFVRIGQVMRRLLDERGFARTLSVLDEWNHDFAGPRKAPMGSAAFLASAIVYMQDGPIDLEAYYRADLAYDDEGHPGKPALALEALGKFADTPVRVASQGADSNGYALLAARSRDGSLVQVLASNYEIDGDKRGPRTTPDVLSVPGLFDLALLPRRQVSYPADPTYVLDIRGLDGAASYQLERYRLSGTQDLVRVESRRVRGGHLQLRNVLPAPAIDLVVLRRLPAAARH